MECYGYMDEYACIHAVHMYHTCCVYVYMWYGVDVVMTVCHNFIVVTACGVLSHVCTCTCMYVEYIIFVQSCTGN